MASSDLTYSEYYARIGCTPSPPYIINKVPTPDSTDVGGDTLMGCDILDDDLNLVSTSVKIWINDTLAWFSGEALSGWTGTRTTLSTGYRYSFAAGEQLPTGSYTVRAYAEDADGNSVDESWSFTVKNIIEDVPVVPDESKAETGIDLKLSTDLHDVVIENYDLQLVAGIDEVGQHLLVALRLFYGEWYLDEYAGMPYYRDFFVAAPNTRVIDAIFRQTILSDADIERLQEFEMTYNSATRKLDVTFVAVSSVGPVDVDEVFP